MKKFKTTIVILLISFFWFTWVSAYDWIVNMEKIGDWVKITNVSVNPISWADALEKMQNWWLSILRSLKVVLSWVIVIYLVYLGFMMVMAMWAEDKLTTAKRQIYYTLLAFLFINIPSQLYQLFSWKSNNDVTDKTTGFAEVTNKDTDANLFINFFNWENTIEGWVFWFIKALIVWIVILQFMMAWIWLISSAWNDEKRKKARARFMNWIYGLIFIWIIQLWVQIVYSWNIDEWQSLFAKIANLALFFAWPVAIFFLILWWFYYITSAWDEAKTKKWTTIIKNTFVAVIILLAGYAFLKDLADFSL